MKRRDFLRTAGAAAAAAARSGLGSPPRRQEPLHDPDPGRHALHRHAHDRAALKRGHTVTFFNRGRTNADLFPGVERITGDRNGDIDGLKGRKWDAVIDNSGYVPRHGDA